MKEKKGIIYDKLEAFVKKFYVNELIRGIILFLGIGLLYFIFTFLLEYFLWLSSSGRSILFWTFILVEVLLLSRFIIFPIFKLFKLAKGIDYTQASKIIGNHFSEIQDKLLNFLQLALSTTPTELVLASIDQKSATLQPIPFGNAINFNKNKKFIPLALIPILFLLFFYLSGKGEVINNSFARVVDYDKSFKKPAPFSFHLSTNSLFVEQNKPFDLLIETKGTVIPENAIIIIDNEEYFLESMRPGVFKFRFDNVQKDISFFFKSNNITSDDYLLKVIKVPTITSFQMQLNYPNYLNKKSDVIQGTGNAVIPEGTSITWRLNTLATSNVSYYKDSVSTKFSNDTNIFYLTKRILNNTDYTISISNSKLKDYEKLQYKLTILKDQYPSINSQQTPDSLKLSNKVILGQISDDYGLSKLQLVYYDKNKPNILYKKSLPVNNKLVDQFVYAFPSGLSLSEGVQYEYYFEVFDNDIVNGYKSSKTNVFTHYEMTQEQKEDKSLQEQNSNINALSKALDKQDKQNEEFEKLKKLDKQKQDLDYKDQKKIQDFINRQKEQDEMMKDFSEKMKENLDKFKTIESEEMKKELLDRLEKNEKEAQKNEKLLKELEELNKKLEKDELFEKADKLQKQSKSRQKSLEQLVELTKRFYVEQKAKQINDKLEKLADKQEELSKQDNPTLKEQEEINKQFDQIKEELNDLKKENEALKKPMDIPMDEQEQKSTKEDLNKASDNLQKKNKDQAKKNQKSAAQKMKQMASKIQQEMDAGGQEQMEEDAKVLRQILDNLLAFSFDEEKLNVTTKSIGGSKGSFNSILKKQQELKEQFTHVDDSLFTLSMRNPKISDKVLTEIEEIHYNLDKSNDNLVNGNRSKGISHQQSVLSSANKLADFLSDLQNQMNNSMSMSSSSGKPKKGQSKGEMQLQDIIQKQKGLGEKMKEGQKPGEKPGDKPGDKPGQKPGDKPGEGQGSSGDKDGQKKGNKSSKNGDNGNENDSDSDGEENAEKLLEIIKEQQELRNELSKQLEKEGVSGNGQKALQQMKDLEKQLINKGFTNDNLQRAMQLNHELLKLESALKQQGQDKKRESNSNHKDFEGTNKQLPPALLNYLQSVEILNRQSLPLHPNFNQKVQKYFKTNDNL